MGKERGRERDRDCKSEEGGGGAQISENRGKVERWGRRGEEIERWGLRDRQTDRQTTQTERTRLGHLNTQGQ